MLIANSIWFAGPPFTGIGPGIVLFAGGYDTGYTQFIDEYNISTNGVFYTGKNLTVGQYALAGVGNTTIGVFGGGLVQGGSYSSATTTMTYATKTVAAGSLLGGARSFLAAAGNANVGIFGGGTTSSAATTRTDSYTYTGNVVVPGSNLGTARYGLAAASTANVAVFSGGAAGSSSSPTYIASTDLYTFSSNAVSPGTNLPTATANMAAAGNTTVAVFAGGNYSTSFTTAQSSVYVYASNTWISGSTLGQARQQLSAGGNSTGGVFSGGSNALLQGGTALSFTDVYNYSSNTRATGTAMGTIFSQGTTCTTPGGFS